MNVNYSLQSAGLLVALVALQQVWGVEFMTATQRAHELVSRLALNGSNHTYDLQSLVRAMGSLAPKL